MTKQEIIDYFQDMIDQFQEELDDENWGDDWYRGYNRGAISYSEDAIKLIKEMD